MVIFVSDPLIIIYLYGSTSGQQVETPLTVWLLVVFIEFTSEIVTTGSELQPSFFQLVSILVFCSPGQSWTDGGAVGVIML